MTADLRPKILLIGRNGQVGWELTRTLAPLGEVVALDSSQLDLGKPADIRRWINDIKPDIIVNAAAYTAVDKAETDQDGAMAINGTALEIIGREAHKTGSLVIHYSTDYVFDGDSIAPYRETDPVNPINVYGKTKLAGEQALASTGAQYIILRTSWVYGLRGHNFLQTMLRLTSEKRQLTIVNDQAGAPTWSRMIAEATAQVIAKKGRELVAFGGIYHLTCQGRTTWYEFARQIVALRSNPLPHPVDIVPITSEQYLTAARRPKNSILDNGKIFRTFGVLLPDWQNTLRMVLEK